MLIVAYARGGCSDRTLGCTVGLLSRKQAFGVVGLGEDIPICSCLSVRHGDSVRRLVDTAKSGTTSTWSIDGDLAEGQHQRTHEFRSASSSDRFIRPIGPVPDLYPQLHLVHLSNSCNLNVNVGLEVPGVFFVHNECLHLIPQKLDILEGCAKVDVYRQLFPHGF